MAEVLGLTASLISIANLGVSLTRTLYDFGATASHACEDIDYISNNVSDYADILELLVEQLEHDRPIHSKKAIRLAERLYDRSYQLFHRIRDLIPDGRRARDHVSFLQRIAWNFKKTRVAHLVGELESLKRTVQLLVQVLCTARHFQAYKDQVGNSEERQKKQGAAHRQFRRTENVIVEWQRANEKLPSLRKASECEDRLQIQAGSAPVDAKEPLQSEEAGSLIKVQGNTLAVIEAATADVGRSESEKRALVLQQTTSWVEQLLDEWTVLAHGQEIGRPSDERNSHEKASKRSSVPAVKIGGGNKTTDRPQSLPPDLPSTPYVTGGGEKTFVNLGRSSSDRKASVGQNYRENPPAGYQPFFQEPNPPAGYQPFFQEPVPPAGYQPFFQEPVPPAGYQPFFQGPIPPAGYQPFFREPIPPAGYQPFFREPLNTHDRPPTAKVAADESRSSETLRNPAYVSQQSRHDTIRKSYGPTRYQVFGDGSGVDSNEDHLSVVAQHSGSHGSKKSKVEDGSPFSIALKRRQESTEQDEVDRLRTDMYGLVKPYLGSDPPNISQHDYEILTERMMNDVFLKADALQLREPEARSNRKELIDQAERHLFELNPQRKRVRFQNPNETEGL